ncbi:MAG: LysM peptidoglycan-binding domain-containing protein [Planctomycetes bacterium]|nr:LysM peptidoglycan-binding domain-containing protein [Planctomycetota bacterium]
MGNLEKYGVLALIFVIVIILVVAIFHGPTADPQPAAAGGAPQTANLPAADPALANRPALADFIRKQQEDQAGQRAQQENVTRNPVVVTPTTPAAGLDRASKTRSYVVAKNDTLSTIAKKELGSKNRWNEILKVNEGLNPKKLKIGQTIQIPVVDGASTVAEDNPAGKKSDKKPTSAGIAAR